MSVAGIKDGEWTAVAFVALIMLFAVVMVACGGDEGGVGITLQEFAVVPDASTAPAGEVTFTAENEGQEVHEFVVIKTDLGATDLPIDPEAGGVDEEGEGMEVVDELEELEPGSSTDLTVDLDAGHYVLICNIVEEEDGETVSHYENGMRTDFTVEE